MNTPVRYGLHLVLMSALLTALPACTIKASTESLSDAALNFLSSTSGKSFLTQDGLLNAMSTSRCLRMSTSTI